MKQVKFGIRAKLLDINKLLFWFVCENFCGDWLSDATVVAAVDNINCVVSLVVFSLSPSFQKTKKLICLSQSSVRPSSSPPPYRFFVQPLFQQTHKIRGVVVVVFPFDAFQDHKSLVNSIQFWIYKHEKENKSPRKKKKYVT